MTTNYPNSLDAFSSKVDNFDDVMAADINNLQDAVAAVEVELGLLPKGAYGDIAARLNAIVAALVTNGDAHDHNGGDGAQIDHVNLANKGTNTHAQIDTFITNNNGGWLAANGTWTYASALTFTVPGDVTGIYQKGTFLKWTQATVKYGVVASSSYSAPNTTVTIIVNTDYTIENAAISANYYSYVANPQGWPGWFNWLPTIVGYSVLPTDVVYRYCVVGGNTVHFIIREVGPGTSNSVALTISVPVNPSAITNLIFGGAAAVVDNGGAQTSYGRWVIDTAGTTIAFGINAAVQGGFTASGGKRVAFCEGFYRF